MQSKFRHVFLNAVAATLLVFQSGSAIAETKPPDCDAGMWEQSLGEEFYQPYQKLLSKHVNEKGLVDYQALKSDPLLKKTVERFACINPEFFKKRSEKERLAFWINAYNALTLSVVAEHYPIEASLLKSVVYPANSIRQIDGVWKEISFEVAGQKKTLHQIEHEILRKDFSEPRIHMALVCAALSCPKLQDEVYLPAELDSQLAAASREFVADSGKGVRLEDDEIQVSSVFDWFAADFKGEYSLEQTGEKELKLSDKQRAVLGFIEKYASSNSVLAERLNKIAAGAPAELSYLDYDWTLNDQK